MIDTKLKILDAAEQLFSEQGYSATSLRHIIAEAGVNLAAVHYHFGSKEDLLSEVVLRKAGPVNAARLALLEKFEQEAAPAGVPLEKILEAFLLPTFEARVRSPRFVKLMGRLTAEGLMPMIAAKHFRPFVERFFGSLRRALPHLSPNEAMWRIHFMIGAMAHSMGCAPDVHKYLGGPEPAGEPPELVQQLIVFCAAGFRAAALSPVVAASETLQNVEVTE